jgi:uncharacterized membrane protein YhaH (DUF805 family)
MNKSFILFNSMKKMFTLKGRASRKEYLIFTIFELLIFTPLLIMEKKYGRTDLLNIAVIVSVGIYIFAYTSVSVRRLHDCDLKGWWYLLNFIFSPVVFLMFCFIKGNKEKNKYGEPPAD